MTAPGQIIWLLPPAPYENLPIVGARRENVRCPVTDSIAAPAAGVKPPCLWVNTNGTK